MLSPLSNNVIGFGIEIRFPKETANPSRIFLAMSQLIDSCQEIQENLILSMPSLEIEPVLIIEDVRYGSLITWLTHRMKRDKPSISFDERKAARFLTLGTQEIVAFGSNTSDFSDRLLSETQQRILEIANDINPVPDMPIYTSLPKINVLDSLKKIQDSTLTLAEPEKASLITSENERISLDFPLDFSRENIEKMLTDRIIENKVKMILKIKKPDHLGSSQWEFKGDKLIRAKMSDFKWLDRFKKREFSIFSGDSIEAYVKITQRYDADMNEISSSYEVLEVLELHQPDEHNSSIHWSQEE
ncbi:MAG: hypothetical protein KME14_18960 [Tildeniella torsiva UHER 1998/13D]|jgi:hypothetical protein|nr:hypothetical protein [Tildeniella torsiva UHER 1998/13D]